MSNRNDYRNWSAEELASDAEATWERMVFCGVPVADLRDKKGNQLKLPRLTYSFAADRLGLRLVQAEYDVVLDADGKPQLDENGREMRENIRMPAYDVAINVKVEGFTDSKGTVIPKGKQYFVADREATNRFVNMSNIEDLASRLPYWVLTGEPLIKDSEGQGQNEQHRCWAVVYDKLTGANNAPEEGIPVVTLDGVSHGAAGAIDSGKSKSATDDMTSNHEILPFPLTRADYVGSTREGYGQEQKAARAKILRLVQGAAKRVNLRLVGANIKASKFTGHESGIYANELVTRWNGFDDICNMAYAFINSIPQKDEAKRQLRPVKDWEVAVAYALYLLKDSEPLSDIKSLSEYTFPKVELQPLQEFLTDIEHGVMNPDGALSDWCKKRVTSERLKDSDESSFAQVLIAMREYFAGNVPVDPSYMSGGENGVTGKKKQSGSVFTALGGADKGAPAKKAKASKEAAE